MPDITDRVRTLDQQLRRERRYVEWVDRYYEGEQPLQFMSALLAEEFGDRIAALVINWPRMIANVYEMILDIEGIRYTGTDLDRDGRKGEDIIWEMFTDNDGAMDSIMAHTEAVINGRSALIAGKGDAGLGEPDPIQSVEHPYEITFTYDPRTGRPVEALKRWTDLERVERATLYLENSTAQFFRDGRRVGGWTLTEDPDEHNIGAVLATSLVNSPRLLRIRKNATHGGRLGRSEFHDIIPLADAANKMGTDMMTSGEFHAMPRRWAVGVTEDDFTDEQGRVLTAWENIAGRVWASDKKPGEVQFGQFPETDLRVFHETIKLLAQLAGHLAFLPQDYLGFTTDNPTSADAIRASETRRVKWAERKQTYLSAGWRRHLNNMVKIRTGKWPEKPIEIVWRDPGTPTIAQLTDAIVKQATGDNPIIPVAFARRRLYTKPEVEEMEADEAKARVTDPVAQAAERLRADVNRRPFTPATDDEGTDAGA